MARPINPNSARQQRIREAQARHRLHGPRPKPKLATEGGRLVIPSGLIDAIQANARERRRTRADNPDLNPFRFDPKRLHPPGSLPPKEVQMAMDQAIGWAGEQWANGGPLGQVFAEGLAFPGYPYLAELAQRPEYRTFSETIATEMTRKWIKFSGKGTAHQQRQRDREMAGDFGLPDPHPDEREADEAPDTSEKQEKIAQVEEFLDNLDCTGAYRLLEMNDGFFGRSHLFHEIGGNDGETSQGREDLQSDIGLGTGDISKFKVNPDNPLTALRGVEAVWTYPTTYNAINPLKASWYKPEVWYTMGMPIHASRLFTQIGRPVPDLLKPAYSFGGISMTQLAMPYVNIWLETRESIGRLIHAFSVMVLFTDMQTLMQPGGQGLIERINLFNVNRDNNGCFVLNKNTEDFKNVSAPLGGLHELQAQAQEHMASCARIPVAIFTGISPTGLNASSEGEIRIFENTIHAFQEGRMRQNLTKTVNFAQLSLWGEIDPDITFEFVQLRELTEKEEAELRKMDAETDDILINGCQALSPEEVRIRIAGDENGPHAGLDPDDMPEPPQSPPGEGPPGEGSPGEEPAPGQPKPGGRINISGREAYTGVGGDEDPFGSTSDDGGEGGVGPGSPGPTGGTFASLAESDPNAALHPGQATGRPTGTNPGKKRHASDADFKEGDHPRAPDGKFGSGGGIGKVEGLNRFSFLDKPREESARTRTAKPAKPATAQAAPAKAPTKQRVSTKVGQTNVTVSPAITGRSKEMVDGVNAALIKGVPELREFDAYPEKFNPTNIYVAASTERNDFGNPDTVPGHETATGVNIRIDTAAKTVHFGEITSKTRGAGSRMVDAVVKALPGYKFSATDWSREEGQQGPSFWEKAKSRHIGKFGGDEDMAADGDWKEGDHPRGQPGNAGQFGPGGGGFKPKPKEPLDVKNLTKIGEKLGSNEGGKYEDSEGRQFYVKKGKSPEHVKSEVLAGKLFRLAGGKTLKYEHAGPQHIATRWEKVDKNNIGKFNDAERAQARADFATHAWLANWDAAGLDNDNYSSKGGQAFPNDLGGALEWRAQGLPKGDAFGDKAGEWDTMRDPKENAQNAALFKGMTPDELRRSALRVALVPDKDIRRAVKDMGKPSEMADKLIARKRDIEQRANGDPKDPQNPVTFDLGASLPVKELNGVPFKQWEPPADWNDVDGQVDDLDGDDEMNLDPGATGKPKKASTGIFVVEPDGRVWLMRPTGRFGGYDQTIPKGATEKGLTLQANAIKEVWEETGLKARITGIAGDIEGDTSVTRYYVGEREAGDPTEHEWEASAVVLVPPHAITDYLNRSRDRTVSKYILDRYEFGEDALPVWLALDEFSETEHPRDEDGKFAPKGSGSFGKAPPPKKPEGKVPSKASVIKGALASGKTAKEVLEILKKVHPDTHYKESDINWYKNKMAKAGGAEAKLAAAGYTPTEIASVMQKQKEADAEKTVAKPEPSPPVAAKPEPTPTSPPKPKAPQASPGDLEKAKKTTPFYYPDGVPPSAEKIVKAYNDLYEGKTLTDIGALNQKVADYKATKEVVDGAKKAEQAAIEAKQKAEQAAATAKAAEETKKEQAENAPHYEALAGIASTTDYGDANEKYAKAQALSTQDVGAIKAYTGNHYGPVNAQLRRGQMSVDQWKYAQKLDRALSKLPNHTETVYRKANLPPEIAALYQPGMVVEERAFTSTSKVQGTWHGDNHYVIKSKTGKDVQKLSSHKSENEVLFRMGTRFHVTKVDAKGGGGKVIHMEEI